MARPQEPEVSDAEASSEEEQIEQATGRWTAEEHERFLVGLREFNKQWKLIADLIKTRTVVQVRTHAQKHFQKLARLQSQPSRPMQREGERRHSSSRRKSSSSGSSGSSSGAEDSDDYEEDYDTSSDSPASVDSQRSSSSSSSSSRGSKSGSGGQRRSQRASAIAAAAANAAIVAATEAQSPSPKKRKSSSASYERRSDSAPSTDEEDASGNSDSARSRTRRTSIDASGITAKKSSKSSSKKAAAATAAGLAAITLPAAASAKEKSSKSSSALKGSSISGATLGKKRESDSISGGNSSSSVLLKMKLSPGRFELQQPSAHQQQPQQQQGALARPPTGGRSRDAKLRLTSAIASSSRSASSRSSFEHDAMHGMHFSGVAHSRPSPTSVADLSFLMPATTVPASVNDSSSSGNGMMSMSSHSSMAPISANSAAQPTGYARFSLDTLLPESMLGSANFLNLSSTGISDTNSASGSDSGSGSARSSISWLPPAPLNISSSAEAGSAGTAAAAAAARNSYAALPWFTMDRRGSLSSSGGHTSGSASSSVSGGSDGDGWSNDDVTGDAGLLELECPFPQLMLNDPSDPASVFNHMPPAAQPAAAAVAAAAAALQHDPADEMIRDCEEPFSKRRCTEEDLDLTCGIVDNLLDCTPLEIDPLPLGTIAASPLMGSSSRGRCSNGMMDAEAFDQEEDSFVSSLLAFAPPCMA